MQVAPRESLRSAKGIPMPNRGSFNRRTGKTTPRNKVKTHWGGKAPAGRTAAPEKTGKARAASPAKA